jgi:toxin ParE1/3/4
LRLVWLPRAIADRDAQVDYLATRSPLAAIDQGDRIDAVVSQLLDHPEIGRPGRVKGTRELVIGATPFITVYRYKQRARRIELIRLLHGSQQYPTD